MKHLGKFALATLLASAISIPAYATSASSNSSAGANTSVSGNTAGANVGVGANVNTNTTAKTGTGAISRTLGTATDTLDRARAEAGDEAAAEINARGSATNTAGSTSNNTVGSTSNNTVGSTMRSGVVTSGAVGTNARAGETIGDRIDRHRQLNADLFASSDLDGSGSLNYDEYVTYSGTTTAQANAQTSFARMDTNNDGFLSQAEIRARGEGEAGTRATQ